MGLDRYDLAIIGGGIAGASLAIAMAPHARVLLVEREAEYRDRVRGEALLSWGAAEARGLDVYTRLREARGVEHNIWRFGGINRRERDLVATTKSHLPMLAFNHPEAQERLFDAAVAAGAQAMRPAIVREIVPGRSPRIRIDSDGSTLQVEARLVVGADGRSSFTRRAVGFDVRRDRPRMRVAGVLLSGASCPTDSVTSHLEPGRYSFLFPQGGGRVRAYISYHAGVLDRPLTGSEAFSEFVAESEFAGVPAEWFAGARIDGPLATFDGADAYVPLPYRDGVALVGDAAATSDPTWGQGLSLALRDARVLRDALLGGEDWDVASLAYAHEHARCFDVVHSVEDWFTDLMLTPGAEADRRRARAMPLIMKDPTRIPDALHSGPKVGADEAARRRFFGED